LVVAEGSSSQVVRLSSTDRVIDPRKCVLDRVLRNTGRVLIDSVAATVYSAMDRAKVKNAENITGPRMFGMTVRHSVVHRPAPRTEEDSDGVRRVSVDSPASIDRNVKGRQSTT